MINANVCSEVYELLGAMDKMTVMKIPMKILEDIKQRRNKDYISKIDKNDIFNRDNVLPETIKYIAWLDVNFWENEEEKQRLKKLHFEQLKQKEIAKSEEYSSDIIFKKRNDNNTKEQEVNINNLPVKVQEENIFKRVIKYIINLFKAHFMKKAHLTASTYFGFLFKDKF